MIPNIDFSAILEYFSLILSGIQLRWLRKHQAAGDDDLTVELVMIIRMLLDILSNYVHLLTIIIRFHCLKQKKRLTKPHLLLHIMHGYRWIQQYFFTFASLKCIFTKHWKCMKHLFCNRATLTQKDVWINMSQNWLDFFWLSGKTPQTLGELVDQIEHRYIHLFNNCRGCKLNIRNQVSS